MASGTARQDAKCLEARGGRRSLKSERDWGHDHEEEEEKGSTHARAPPGKRDSGLPIPNSNYEAELSAVFLPFHDLFLTSDFHHGGAEFAPVTQTSSPRRRFGVDPIRLRVLPARSAEPRPSRAGCLCTERPARRGFIAASRRLVGRRRTLDHHVDPLRQGRTGLRPLSSVLRCTRS
jgi:hypothetical protein